MAAEKYQVFRQVFPIIVGAFTGVSFGTMFGWASVVYPLLVDPHNAPILMTWDQTALIAGILMEGNIIGVAFSGIEVFGSRVGVLLGCTFQVAGWIVMYYSSNVIELGVARGLVGFGNGFALGQLKMYINETCNPNLEKICLEYMPLALNVGVVFVYIIGPFTTFRSLSIVCFCIPAIALLLFAVVPKKNYTPIIEGSCVTTVAGTINKQSTANSRLRLIDVLKEKEMLICLFLSSCIIFVPQYTGGAPNIVYSQVVHKAAFNPYPQECAIVYSIVFLLATFLGIKYTKKAARKPVIIASCVVCAVLLGLVCLYFYCIVDLLKVSPYFVWSPLVLLCLYNIFHSMGINVIPILLIADVYPKNGRAIGSKFYVMYYSLSGVLSTKICQVLFTRFGMHVAYAFFSCVAMASAVLIGCFVKEPSDRSFKPKLGMIIRNLHIKKRSKVEPNIKCIGYTNKIDLRDETA